MKNLFIRFENFTDGFTLSFKFEKIIIKLVYHKVDVVFVPHKHIESD